ncbi:MAG: hypothetical protein EPO27_17955 [Betaproteobacteria bacterium]|nr:MAG: hypothetical protein EPO27_17955 [Betaproteobacteria bacterium]
MAHRKRSAAALVVATALCVLWGGTAAADDEAVRFINNAFVHNPLLDPGGDPGAKTMRLLGLRARVSL